MPSPYARLEATGGARCDNPAVSFSYRFSLQSTLVRPVPPDVVEWIESCRAGNLMAPRFEVSELAADMADQAGSLLAAAAVDLTAWGHLSVQAVVHEAEGEGTYGLAMLCTLSGE